MTGMSRRFYGTTRNGIAMALGAAFLFGLSMPGAKRLLGEAPPVLVAGLLYCGSAMGLSIVLMLFRARASEARLGLRDLPWLAGAILTGGVVGPVLLMWGLRATAASEASLLLNLEAVFTVALARLVFRESLGNRVAIGMSLIIAGGILLSSAGAAGFALSPASLAIGAACLCWAIDNNLTQRVSAADPLLITALKSAVAGSVNVGIALATGTGLPSMGTVVGATLVGFLGYGLSLSLFVAALRHLGTARTGTYFAVAPFVGAVASVSWLDEPLRPALAGAAILMGVGTWLQATERHVHVHEHQSLAHSHRHAHDEHHQHQHRLDDPQGDPHAHAHVHQPITHSHPHYPDLHHRHSHR